VSAQATALDAGDTMEPNAAVSARWFGVAASPRVAELRRHQQTVRVGLDNEGAVGVIEAQRVLLPRPRPCSLS